MHDPLVTVICLSYNHAKYVAECLESVLSQSYPNIQVIAVDDASTDNTREVIIEFIRDHPSITFLPLSKNSGNCKAFNKGLRLSKGKYIIDLAADDLMLPGKLRNQVDFFEKLDRSYGVVFTNASYCDDKGNFVRNHFDYLFRKKLLDEIPQGDVYKHILSKFFIPPQTMMVRTEVFHSLEGYDEALAYEDFDFWVRSSRIFKYAYLPQITMKIRLGEDSMSRRAYKKGDKQLHSTYLVCKKAVAINQSPEEDVALAKRIMYEIRQSVLSQNRLEAELFYLLLKEIGYGNLGSQLWMLISRLNLPLSPLRDLYQKIRSRS